MIIAYNNEADEWNTLIAELRGLHPITSSHFCKNNLHRIRRKYQVCFAYVVMYFGPYYCLSLNPIKTLQKYKKTSHSVRPRLVARHNWKGRSVLSDGILWSSGRFGKWRLTFGGTPQTFPRSHVSFPPAPCVLSGHLLPSVNIWYASWHFGGGISISIFSLRSLLTSNLHLERKSLFNYRPDFLSGPLRSPQTPRVICSTEWKCDISKLFCHRWNMKDERRAKEG